MLAYLSRYTHRIAIGNRRILALDKTSVTFAYKDYADDSKRKAMTLGLDEFLRRFCLHILPSRFVKIRHYGLLANRGRDGRVERARHLIGESTPESPPTVALEIPAEEKSPQLTCANCGSTRLRLLAVIRPMRATWNPAPKIDSS